MRSKTLRRSVLSREGRKASSSHTFWKEFRMRNFNPKRRIIPRIITFTKKKNIKDGLREMLEILKSNRSSSTVMDPQSTAVPTASIAASVPECASVVVLDVSHKTCPSDEPVSVSSIQATEGPNTRRPLSKKRKHIAGSSEGHLKSKVDDVDAHAAKRPRIHEPRVDDDAGMFDPSPTPTIEVRLVPIAIKPPIFILPRWEQMRSTQVRECGTLVRNILTDQSRLLRAKRIECSISPDAPLCHCPCIDEFYSGAPRWQGFKQLPHIGVAKVATPAPYTPTSSPLNPYRLPGRRHSRTRQRATENGLLDRNLFQCVRMANGNTASWELSLALEYYSTSSTESSLISDDGQFMGNGEPIIQPSFDQSFDQSFTPVPSDESMATHESFVDQYSATPSAIAPSTYNANWDIWDVDNGMNWSNPGQMDLSYSTAETVRISSSLSFDPSFSGASSEALESGAMSDFYNGSDRPVETPNSSPDEFVLGWFRGTSMDVLMASMSGDSPIPLHTPSDSVPWDEFMSPTSALPAAHPLSNIANEHNPAFDYLCSTPAAPSNDANFSCCRDTWTHEQVGEGVVPKAALMY